MTHDVPIVVAAAVPLPVLPTKVVPVAAFGGAVVVRAGKLSERLRIDALPDAERAFALLAVAVVDASGAPIHTADQWDSFATLHPTAFADLANTAASLWGYSAEAAEDARKNSEAAPS